MAIDALAPCNQVISKHGIIHWLCRINGSLSTTRKYFYYLCHFNFDILLKKNIYFSKLIEHIKGSWIFFIIIDFGFACLQSHPEVVEAGRVALKEYGAGLSSVRFICGTQVRSQCTCSKDLPQDCGISSVLTVEIPEPCAKNIRLSWVYSYGLFDKVVLITVEFNYFVDLKNCNLYPYFTQNILPIHWKM